MSGWAVPAAIGFVSGVLSAVFGVGGGILTTPAIRLLLHAPAIIAVGTPLPVIIPSAATGAVQYVRRGIADLRAGLTIGLAGVVPSVLGAQLATELGGSTVLVGTAVIILYAATDMALQVLRPEGFIHRRDEATRLHGETLPVARLAIIGLVAGAYSGFFGLGGGFVLVPLLSRWLRMPIKAAIGTSLVAVTMLAVPGTVAHAYAGNIDWPMAGAMILGVVPGALLGVRITLGTADRVLRIAFVVLLVATAGLLATTELQGWIA